MRILLPVSVLVLWLAVTSDTWGAAGPETLRVETGGTDPTCVTPCGTITAAINRGTVDLQNGAASSVLIVVGPGRFRDNPAFVAGPITVQGAGANQTIVDGGKFGGVFAVAANTTVTMTDLTITNGTAYAGGGVFNEGHLTLQRVNVTANAAIGAPGPRFNSGVGGGIFSRGSLELDDSTVLGNTASNYGGGVASIEGTLTANRDAVIGNSVVPGTVGLQNGEGGGLYLKHAVDFKSDPTCCTVNDSTIAANTALGSQGIGGAISGAGPTVLMRRDTIAGNRATQNGGGVEDDLVKIGFEGSILAYNQPDDCNPSYIEAWFSIGHNLYSDTTCMSHAASTDISGVDPLLGPLADNGGPTKTLAIPSSSPAYDATGTCPGTDQRGISRLQRGAARCDLGAYQVGAPTTYVANPPAGWVTAYATGADGDARPVLTIGGPHTGLNHPTGVLADVLGNVYVADPSINAVTEYAPETTGDVAPLRTIAGPLTQLNQPQDIAVDGTGRLFVTNLGGSVTEYAAGTSGNVAPVATIAGAGTKLSQPHGIVLDESGAVRVTTSAGTVNTYAATANGNVAPLHMLGPSAGLTNPQGLNFDPAGRVVVVNPGGARIDTFAATATGGGRSLTTLVGASPGLSAPVGLDLDLAGDVFVDNSLAGSVTEFGPGATGTAAPTATIAGVDTGLHSPAFLSELPPPPAPHVTARTARRQSHAQILRRGITVRLVASGRHAFRADRVTVTAAARSEGRTIARARATSLRPGRTSILLVPTKDAAKAFAIASRDGSP